MAREIETKRKKKNGSRMSSELEKQLERVINTLSAKLAVRNCQHRIALEGLRAILEFGDITVADKTIGAMLDCIPEEDS